MAQLKLTEKSVSAIPPPLDTAQDYYWDTELHGFGVVVGRRSRTFVVRSRVSGSLVKRTIGALGQPRDDGHTWTVLLARQRAKELLGQMVSGTRPEKVADRRSGGPTLRDGLEMHVSNMRKRNRSERSIGTIESEIPRLLGDWMDRPISELAGVDLVALHDRLTNEGKTFLANRIVAQVSAVWNTLDKVHELEGRNPARAVTRNAYVPNRERVNDLVAWYATVQTLTPLRRDLQLFCLFTGMRSEAARHVRWEHVDGKALTVPKPKGGESKAFRLPLPKSIVAMLESRKRENRDLFGSHGGDQGWVFPSLSRSAPFEVQPLAEPKEYRTDPTTKQKVAILPGLHTLRRTYLSVATEAGISEIDRHVLANHAFGRQTVNATYIEQAFGHLADCQAMIETALWTRIRGEKTRSRGGRRASR